MKLTCNTPGFLYKSKSCAEMAESSESEQGEKCVIKPQCVLILNLKHIFGLCVCTNPINLIITQRKRCVCVCVCVRECVCVGGGRSQREGN